MGYYPFNHPPASTNRLVSFGSVWNYLDDGSDQGLPFWETYWFAHPDYNDGFWHPESPAELGYGDGGEATVVDSGPSSNRYMVTYFRKTFDVEDASIYSGLRLQVQRDDGVVVYLNGALIHRDNIDDNVEDRNRSWVERVRLCGRVGL